MLRDAGWPVWPLLATSILALALIFERIWSLRTRRVLPAGLTDEVLGRLAGPRMTEEAIAAIEAASPLGRVLAATLRAAGRGDNAGQIAAATEETGRRVAHELERYLNALGTIATVAPLLGLFGTVVGMIEIFAGTEQNGASPVQLAHGISVALYNTAFGLMIAIPALVAWRSLRRHLDELVVELEWQAARVVDAARRGAAR